MREKLKIHDGNTPGKAFEVKLEYPKVATMSDILKCPFCNETKLDKGIKLQNGGCMLGCPKCKLVAPNIFWQELIRTRKALDVAFKGLDDIIDSGSDGYWTAIKTEEQIKTALEQKDAK